MKREYSGYKIIKSEDYLYKNGDVFEIVLGYSQKLKKGYFVSECKNCEDYYCVVYCNSENLALKIYHFRLYQHYLIENYSKDKFVDPFSLQKYK